MSVEIGKDGEMRWERVSSPERLDFGIDVSGDGRTVWVHAADGSCIGRFSKRFGMDVHKGVAEQLAGGSQCLHCTHEPAGPEAWSEFRKQILEHYHIEVQAELLSWNK